MTTSTSNLILKVLGGSRAYGLATDGSDTDYTEVYIEDPFTVLGSAAGPPKPQHTIGPEGDVQRYPLRHFLHLALKGNPSVIEALYAPVQHETPAGHELRAIRGAIVSQNIIPRYRGFIRAQTEKLLGLRGQKRVSRPDLVNAHGYDSKYAAHVLRLGYQCMELLSTEQLVLPMPYDDPRRIQIRAVLDGQVPFEDWWVRAIAVDAAIASERSPRLRKDPMTDVVERYAVRFHLRQWLALEMRDESQGLTIW